MATCLNRMLKNANNSRSFETIRIFTSKYNHNKLDYIKEKAEKTRIERYGSKSANKGKTYEEIYGKEKAEELKDLRSKNFKKLDKLGTKNPMYDDTIYTFYNIKTKETYTSTRLKFYTNFELSKSGVCMMIKQKIIFRNWKVLYPETENSLQF